MNTIMLKAAVVSVEWDKKNNKILYLGTMNSSLVKVYDINLKKVIQDLELNKSFSWDFFSSCISIR